MCRGNVNRTHFCSAIWLVFTRRQMREFMFSSSSSLCVSGSDAASGNDVSKKTKTEMQIGGLLDVLQKNTFLMDGNPTKPTVDMLRMKGCDPQMFVFRANHHHQTNPYTDTKHSWNILTFYFESTIPYIKAKTNIADKNQCVGFKHTVISYAYGSPKS